MPKLDVGFTEQILPPAPKDEIPRDAQVRKITSTFGPECQKQMVVGGIQTGKTNLLTQFVRLHKDQCIGYFITSSPLTQQKYAFLYAMCYQLSTLLGTSSPPENVSLENLENLFTTLSIKLLKKAREETFYYVIDGLDQALEGLEGERIIDLFPLQTAPYSPYLLFSCRPDQIERLSISVRCYTIEPSEFSRLETETYLSGAGFSAEEIARIHKVYHGVPGYLRIIKETKLAAPAFKPESAPQELDQLLGRQIDVVFEASDPPIVNALEILACCPVSLPCRLLSELTQLEEPALIESLRHTGLIRYNAASHRAECLNDLIQKNIRDRTKNRLQKLIQDLTKHISERYPEEEFVLTHLFKEARDYEGLRRMLSQEAIVAVVERTNDISNVIGRLRLAAQMAKQNSNIGDLIQWTMGVTSAKSFLAHAVSTDEINALLSIGKSQEALNGAYSIPETSVRIRLLARAYASMKERGEHIPKEALDELEARVENLDLESLDKEVSQKIAIDLFPILPDAAFSFLEKAMGQEEQGIVEAAIRAIESNLQESQKAPSSTPKSRESWSYIAQILSSWLDDRPLSKLVQELEPIKNTKAKEYIIRQWCRQNRESDEIVQAVDLWLDSVVGDRGFVIPLKNLRHISEVVVSIPIDERKRLIDRLKVPASTALDSPKEEWTRLHLNLAEALFEIDAESARTEIENVHTNVLQSELDLDTMIFCLARIWVTVNKFLPEELRWITSVWAQFEEAFQALLESAGEQLEPTIETFETLVDVDPVCALIAASELNTNSRRVYATRVILRAILRKRGQENFAGLIEDALVQLDKIERDYALVEMAAELNAREVVLASPNLDVLLKYAWEIADPTYKAECLSDLAVLCRHISENDPIQIMEQAIDAWRKEDDLKIKLSLGFKLVERLSKLDIAKAEQLYAEVHDLKYQPGSTLAIGDLGATFAEMLELATRSILAKDLSEPNQAVQDLEHLIMRIASRVVRLQLLTDLAASAYRVGLTQYANDLVRSRIISAIEAEQPAWSELDRSAALALSLPVIFEYDFSTAQRLSNLLPYPIRDQAWHSTVFWSLCRSFLGDHLFEPSELQVASDYPRLERTVKAAGEIKHDQLLQDAIDAISSSVKVSFDSMVDLTQALDILQKLDSLTSNLPEPGPRNIKHEGYGILAEANIHGARSTIYVKAKQKRGLSTKDIGNHWKEICARARSIPNITDRAYVTALVAAEMHTYYEKASRFDRELLKEAESLVTRIPTMIDRGDVLQTIAASWELLGEKTAAQVAIEQAFTLANQMKGIGAEERLKILIQAAHKLNPGFAEDLLSRLDTSRLAGQATDPVDIALEVEKLRSNPSQISPPRFAQEVYGTVWRMTARRLLKDFATGKGRTVASSTMIDWLINACSCRPEDCIEVVHWVVENIHRRSQRESAQSQLNVFLGAAELTYELAKWVARVKGEGVPEAIKDSYPGLSAKVVSFRAGEVDRAKQWVQNWLMDNVKDYLKICDPYFGRDELEYLTYVPPDCRVLIVTTDSTIPVTDGPSRAKEELEYYWKHNLTSRALPQVQLLIIPKKLEDRFHDRAIITTNGGLDVGPSLNGLGKSFQKITLLSEEDARELEVAYVDRMLNNATWFMEGTQPIVLFLGD